jgi:hypothetical protein
MRETTVPINFRGWLATTMKQNQYQEYFVPMHPIAWLFYQSPFQKKLHQYKRLKQYGLKNQY